MDNHKKFAIVYLIYIALGILVVCKYMDFRGAEVNEIPVNGIYSAQNVLPAKVPLIIHLKPSNPDYLAPEHLLVSVSIPSQNFTKNFSLNLVILSDIPSIYAPEGSIGLAFPHFLYQNQEDHPITYNVSIVPDTQGGYRIKIIYNFFTDAVSASIVPLASILIGMVFFSVIIVLVCDERLRHYELVTKRNFLALLVFSLILNVFFCYNGIILSDLTGLMDFWGGFATVVITCILSVIATISGRWEDLKRWYKHKALYHGG